MNRKTIKLALLIFIFGLATFLGYKVITKTQEKNAIVESIKTIPDFSFTTLSNNVFTKKNLKSNLPTVFLYFNSECDLCHYEAQSINEDVSKFNDIQLVFVSTEPIEDIKTFSEKYNLNDRENIVFLNDAKDDFSKLFNATSIPFILIYDKERNLIKTHKGQLNAKGILKVLNNKN